MAHQVKGLGIQTVEKQRGSPVLWGKGSVESGFLKAEQTYGDLRVTPAGKKRSSGNGSRYY